MLGSQLEGKSAMKGRVVIVLFSSCSILIRYHFEGKRMSQAKVKSKLPVRSSVLVSTAMKNHEKEKRVLVFLKNRCLILAHISISLNASVRIPLEKFIQF